MLLTDAHLSTLLQYYNPGEGGILNKVQGGSALGSRPLSFYKPFLTEKVPLSGTFHIEWYPFHLSSMKTGIPFTNLLVRCVMEF